MAVIPPNDSINRIVSALGLENVRSLTISVAVNSAVVVVTEQYVTGNQMENLAIALETKEWMLVPKGYCEGSLTGNETKEWVGAPKETIAASLTDAEREAIEVCIQDIRFDDVQATLRGLLDRTR